MLRLNEVLSMLPMHLVDQNFINHILLTCENTLDDHDKLNLIVPHVNNLLARHRALDHQRVETEKFNPAQSTHIASVHQSVGDSLKKLNDRYHDIDVNKNISSIITFAVTLNRKNYPNTDSKQLEAA